MHGNENIRRRADLHSEETRWSDSHNSYPPSIDIDLFADGAGVRIECRQPIPVTHYSARAGWPACAFNGIVFGSQDAPQCRRNAQDIEVIAGNELPLMPCLVASGGLVSPFHP